MKAEAPWLSKLAERARAELLAKKRKRPEKLLETLARAAPSPVPFERSIRRAKGIALVAEVKRRAPERVLDRELDVTAFAKDAEAGGAAALAVWTEGVAFGGALEDLSRARAGSVLPLVRLDVLVDPWQLLESRVAGASAVLLTAALLPGKELTALLAGATRLAVESLVEVGADEELERALDAGAARVLVDRRDLRTGELDPARTERLLTRARNAGALALAKDGIGSPEEAVRLVDAGADAIVAGTHLVLAADRARAARALVDARPRA